MTQNLTSVSKQQQIPSQKHNKLKTMKYYKILILILSILLRFALKGNTQSDERYTISGYIKGANTGEELISASLFVKETGQGVVSNLYGFYSLTLPAGDYEVIYSYIGFDDNSQKITLTKDIRLDIELSESGNLLSEVTITAEEIDENIQSTQMSRVNVDIEAVKRMPALFGEVDIIKAIQLIPGVKALGEGTSGFYVRGGNADQNLVLLDEAPIYNASHLLGFFSSFNPDAIKDMQLYKGGIPARYGGRLSSVLDIRMKEGNSKKFGGTAGIGSIMSRLAIEAPVGDKGSFILSGRRSYIDVMAKLYNTVAGRSTNNDNKFYFYDLNAKGNYTIDDNNRVMLSGYFGRDIIGIDDFGVAWGNKTATARWNHIFSPKLFSNLTFYFSDYDYFLKVIDPGNEIKWNARLQEFSAKADFTTYLSPDNTLQFGAQSIRHGLKPGTIQVFNQDSLLTDFKIMKNQSLENAIYVNDEIKVNDDLTINAGLRLSSLHNLGPQSHVNMNENFETIDTSKYEGGIYHSYYNLEPRLGLKYSFGSQSIKASYNRTTQYIQLASNGNASTPFDIWFTSSPNVKPQLADQYAIGYFKNFANHTYEFSAETYYKNYTNAIDFKERASLLLNENLEGELRTGVARAYGLELLAKKEKGKLTGWLGYTYAKVEKKINTINDNQWYNAKYDKPHEFTVVLSYALTNKWTVSSNFVYSTGSAVTFPTGKYEFEGAVVPVYSERNGERLPDYHRLDVSAIYKPTNKIFGGRVQSEWVFGIYNVYNRKNAYSIDFRQEESNPNITYAEKSAVFSIVPSITYNAKF